MNAPAPQISGRESGATLIELLVYLALAATIILLASSSIQIVQASATRATIASRHSSTLGLALGRLAHELEGIERVAGEANGKPVFAFSGSATGMRYMIASRDGALADVQLGVRRTSGGDRLIRTVASAATDLLPAGPYTVRFAYRSFRGSDTGWLNTWPAQNRLPDLIRIRIVETGAAQIPDLIIRPRRDAEPACNDPKAPGCTLATAGVLQ